MFDRDLPDTTSFASPLAAAEAPPGLRSAVLMRRAFARHYGITWHTCVPLDPASKGGSESSVKIARADLVPKDTNLILDVPHLR